MSCGGAEKPRPCARASTISADEASAIGLAESRRPSRGRLAAGGYRGTSGRAPNFRHDGHSPYDQRADRSRGAHTTGGLQVLVDPRRERGAPGVKVGGHIVVLLSPGSEQTLPHATYARPHPGSPSPRRARNRAGRRVERAPGGVFKISPACPMAGAAAEPRGCEPPAPRGWNAGQSKCRESRQKSEQDQGASGAQAPTCPQPLAFCSLLFARAQSPSAHFAGAPALARGFSPAQLPVPRARRARLPRESVARRDWQLDPEQLADSPAHSSAHPRRADP